MVYEGKGEREKKKKKKENGKKLTCKSTPFPYLSILASLDLSE